MKNIAIILLAICAIAVPLQGCSKKTATTSEQSASQQAATSVQASVAPTAAPAAAATGAAAGPAGAASAQLITPPVGWNATSPPQGTVGAWLHPGDEKFTQNVNLTAQTYNGSLDDYVAANIKELKESFANFNIESSTSLTICGDHSAQLLKWSAAVNAQPIEFEQVATLWGTTAYVATYSRSATQPEVPEAVDSIKTVCGGK